MLHTLWNWRGRRIDRDRGNKKRAIRWFCHLGLGGYALPYFLLLGVCVTSGTATGCGGTNDCQLIGEILMEYFG
jgi:hypothetical protein